MGSEPKNPYRKPENGEQIVITGIAGKFPNSHNIYHLRDNLFNKVDMVFGDFDRREPVHPDVPKRTGKMYNVEKFDAGCFGKTSTQSNSMDPVMRMLLERTYEAIVDAGYHPLDFEGTKTGIFLAFCFSETEKHVVYGDLISKAEALIGTQRSTIAQNLSYYLKTKGPVIAFDTACSSALFALHQAYHFVQEGVCEKAIVCGANICLNPLVSLQFKRLGVLNLRGMCKSFDDDGDGYVRSESIVVCVLEKAKHAKRIYSEIVYIKTNCDGYKEEGVTFPSSAAQEALLRDFYTECGINPTTLSYMEAHGTGTKAGDTQELRVIDDVFCKRRKRPLYIGAIKSNIGHAEPASGLCSIVKVILGMETGTLPPNIHYETPRKGVEGLEVGRMLVVTDKIPLPDQRGLFGVSNFGFGGANSHVLLRWNSKNKKNTEQSNSSLPRLICVSSRVKTGIYSILDDYRTRKCNAEFAYIIHQAFRKSMPNHLYKGYGIYDNFGEIKRCLKEVQLEKRKLYLVFSNFNKDWLKLGDHLMGIPIFARSIESIQTVVSKLLNFDISKVIRNQTDVSLINQILSSIAIQISLAEILKELNLMPDHIVGFGSGELLAAYLDNYLTLEQTILALFHIISVNLGEINGKRIKILQKFLPSRKKIYGKWIPLCEEKLNFGCAKYFANIISANQSDLKKLIPSDAYTLVIGPSVNIFKTKNFNLIPSDSKDYVVDFFNTLGSLYMNGFDMELDKLYPPIELPVSRGTPMLSPLIEWNHSDWNVHQNEKRVNTGHKVIRIASKNEDWEFIVGHVVDGRTLFPATGYLVLVWETFAIMLGKLLSNMKVVFEDVKYMRASNVPLEGSLELVVVIHMGTQLFEIVEGGVTIVTGRIFEKTSEHTLIGIPSIISQKPELIMTEEDVYKELKLRGYHYTGKFRGIRKCSVDATWGVIQWEDNWISFMDSVLQLYILQRDTRSTFVPTSIDQIIIDAPKHLDFTEKMKNMVPTYSYKHLDLLKAGGVEMNGFGLNAIARKKGDDPVLEISKFIANDTKLKFQDSIRSLVQVVLENSNMFKIKVVEHCVEDQSENQMVSPVIQASLSDLPLIQHDIAILTSKAIHFPGITVRNKALSTESNCLILIVKNLLETVDISVALKVVKDVEGFVISRESLDVDLSKFSHSPFMVICCHIVETETLVLLRLHVKKVHDTKFIDLSKAVDNLDNWIPELQNLLKEDLNVVIYAEDRASSGTLGLVNCLKCETYGSRISCILTMDEAPKFDPNLPFYQEQLEKNMAINIWKDGSWGTYRYLTMPQANVVENEHCYVNVTTRGDLSTLTWLEGNNDDFVSFEEDNIYIYYSALNFRDLMTASGKIPPDAVTTDRIEQECTQGFEFAGRNSIGERIMGMMGKRALGTTTRSKVIVPIPDHWSMEDAATVMVTYGIVLEILFYNFDVKPGQTILIHSGTGGVGLAAINLCLYFGLTVFITVGTAEKHDFLRKHYPQIQDDHIGSSRDTSFEDMVYEQTKGRGVDYVLNSLAEEKLLASVRCLANCGKFLEIGKFDLSNNNALALHLLERGADFVSLSLERPIVYKDSHVHLRTMEDLIKKGAIKPLPRTVFGINDVEKAFRHMGVGKHIGKVLIKIRDEEPEKVSMVQRKLFKAVPRFYCKSESSYVIYGGLGGFGLELADLLIMKGVKKLVLASRSGLCNGYQRYRIRIWESYGVTVITSTLDASTEAGCTELLTTASELGPLDGIFNLAVVLKDALFENQTPEQFRDVLIPKASCTRNFDTVSRKLCPHLRYFVVFSSLSCGRGIIGQTNYGMANSIMERICEKRKKDGYPALAIQWGAVGDVGLIAKMQAKDQQELIIGGTRQQRISNCLQVMDQFLRQDEPIVASMLVAEKKYNGKANNLFDEVTNIMGITNFKSISMHTSFPELGMDSMTAVEIKQTLEREYEIFLTAQDIRNLTFAKLKELYNSHDSSANVPALNQNASPIDAPLFLRFTGSEEPSNIPVIKVKTMLPEQNKDKIPHVILLPGIEGITPILKHLCRKLQTNVSCMRYCVDYKPESITELAKSVLPHIEVYQNEDLIIIAYSFGTVVATEVLTMLESKGRIVRAIFIDGSPDMMRDMVCNHFPSDDEALFQSLLLSNFLKEYIPHDTLKHKEALLNLDTYEERIDYFINILPKIDMSKKHITDLCVAFYGRLTALIKYKSTDNKFKSKVTLFKAKCPSFINVADDYGLSKICYGDVEKFSIEGNHVTILEKDDLAAEINRIISEK